MVEPISGPQSTGFSNKTKVLDEEQLRQASKDLEAAFIAEMLKSAKFGESRESFGGGIGEEQFSSFLRDNYAQEMANAGGFGLAEHIFNSLKVRAENG
ncbi:MAG: rod-binding protein [Pseudomonadota bacterium]